MIKATTEEEIVLVNTVLFQRLILWSKGSFVTLFKHF